MAESSMSDKQWAMLCHLGALAGFIVPLGNIIFPLVIWSMKKEESPLIDEHGKASLNFQISVTIYSMISGILILALIGIILLPAVIIFSIVCVVMASIKADKGEVVKYPLSITFIK